MKWNRLSPWILSIAALVLIVAAETEARQATVRGGQRVFVRRGPGLDFQAFATVVRGERVEVEEVAGRWALVRTPNGSHGYMHGFYLQYLDDGGLVASQPPGGASGVPEPTAEPTPTRELRALMDGYAGILEEMKRLREELRPLPNDSTPGEEDDDENVVALRAEVRRLVDTTDALRRRLNAPVGSVGEAALPGGERWPTSSLIGTNLVTLVVVWLIAGAVARRQERSRRSRIRF